MAHFSNNEAPAYQTNPKDRHPDQNVDLNERHQYIV